jgi:hypothetical protein
MLAVRTRWVNSDEQKWVRPVSVEAPCVNLLGVHTVTGPPAQFHAVQNQ